MKLNIGTKDELEIEGYQPNKNKKIATIVLSVLTCGLLFIFLSWKASIKVRMTHSLCPPGNATVLLVKDIYNQVWKENVHAKAVVSIASGKKEQKFFFNKKIKYIWDEAEATFIRLSYPPSGTRVSDFVDKRNGLTEEEAKERAELFGENAIHIEIPSIFKLFISQAYNPFYIFQAYTIIIWCVQGYFIYSGCIFFLSVISIVLNIWETRKQTKVLREKMFSESTLRVLRSGRVQVLDSKKLVPGDAVLIGARRELLEADGVLLEGSAIVNEAILTGESFPLTKIRISQHEETLFSLEKHQKHMLHCGTQVLQVRGGCDLRALVTQTGFETVKGEMVRSILFPKPINFQIYSDFLRLFAIFIPLGVAAMIWSLVHWSRLDDVPVTLVIFNSIDLLTFVIPPIIPASITAINLWTQKRLQKENIFCLSSNFINLAGPVDLVCFDKTGTLTEDDLSLEGVLPCENAEFLPPVKDLKSLPISSKLTQTLSTCHSVARDIEGNTIGHPLDIKIFNAIGWTLFFDSEPLDGEKIKPLFVVSKETHITGNELQVYKVFPFESGEQRMTVVALDTSTSHFQILVKGAPEKIASLASKYTVPVIFTEVLEWYAKQGLRVLAAASKTLPPAMALEEICNAEREVLENDLVFHGLIVLQNKLKPETTSALQVLHNAAISTVMITGDNLLTGANVARQCGLVTPTQQIIFVRAEYVASSATAVQHLHIHFTDSEQTSERYSKQGKVMSVLNPNYVFGIEGESFSVISKYDKGTLRKIVHRGKIFARMKPEQKIEVIEVLQQIGHQVAMCGDGCNDCGALKSAHVGISLSSNEASVAAPFTSLTEGIGCISTLIREGRASLISTYTSFKYNIVCCFGSLIVALFMFKIYTEPSDTQYLILDLVLITVPSLMIGNTGASAVLHAQRPTRRIVHPLHLFSIISFLGLQTLLFWITWQYVRSQLWFKPAVPISVGAYSVPGYESTVIFIQACFAIVVGALVFSHDFPFRKRIYTNKIMSGYIVFATALCIVFTFCEADWLLSFMCFLPFPYRQFKWVVFLSVLLMAAMCFVWERWVLYGVLERSFLPWLSRYAGPRLPFEHLEASMSSDSKWPKLGEEKSHLVTMGNDNLEITAQEKPNNSSFWKPHGFYRKTTKRQKFIAEVRYSNSSSSEVRTGTKPRNYGAVEAPEVEMLLNPNNTTSFQTAQPCVVHDQFGPLDPMQVQDSRHLETTPEKEPNDKDDCSLMVENIPQLHLEEIVVTSPLPLSNEASVSSQPPPLPTLPPSSNIQEFLSIQNERGGPVGGSADTAYGSGSMVNLIREMNSEWAKIRNSLHESMKELTLEDLSWCDTEAFILSRENEERRRSHT